MRDIDAMIDEALGSEERELLRGIGEEPGFFGQLFGIFTGPTGWVSAMMMIGQVLTFAGGAWAAWQFFGASDVLDALHWGLPAGVLLIVSLTIKLALWPQMHTNRLLRELKRIELQIARSRS